MVEMSGSRSGRGCERVELGLIVGGPYLDFFGGWV